MQKIIGRSNSDVSRLMMPTLRHWGRCHWGIFAMAVVLSIVLLIPDSIGTAAQAASTSKKSNPVQEEKQKTTGFVLKMHTRTMGLASCKITRDGFIWESSILVVAADRLKRMVTMGDQQTRKCFSFPSEKFKYYIGLMGFSEVGDTSNREFKRLYKFSQWHKTRSYKVGDLDLVEYERHVLNPPPGRTRTQLISVVNFPEFPPSFTSLYNEVTRIEAGAPTGLVAENKTIITNPRQTWAMVTLDSATKTMLTADDVKLNSKEYKKVNAMSELFVQEKSKKDPLDELRDKKN